ncbi:MAG: apolipoprotein N-acyltransferase [Sphingomonadaceae bacterium]|nr:apolipoprotein N-acyltransferase [Sphingomonadaceae bacterium]
MKRALIALAAGAVSATGFAPLGLWPLTLIALAALMWIALDVARLRHAFALGWLFGVGHFGVGITWIATAFTYQAAMPAWLGWVAVALLALYLAIYPALATAIAWRIGKGSPPIFALVFAAAWILTEYVRAFVFTGFVWNPLAAVATSTIGTPEPMLAVAASTRLIGTYGLSGIVALTAGGLLLLALRRYIWGASLLAAPALAPLLGLAGASMSPIREGGREIAIRVIQPNINQDVKWDPALAARNFALLAEQTGETGDRPRLIFWPEAAVPEYVEDDPLARARLASLLGPGDLLLLGATKVVWGEGVAGRPRVEGALNSLFVMDARGRLLGRYDKAHLVPYGEYLPMRPILSAIGLSQLAPGDIDFGEGPGPLTIALPGFGTMGGQICYEMIFSGEVVDRANRPDFLFNPSNDAWFGRWGPPQHLAQARLRAIEEGLPIVRSTPTGISAVIDADGRVLDSLPWREAGTIDATLPPPRAPTPFARLGNLLPMLLAAALLALAFALRRRAG